MPKSRGDQLGAFLMVSVPGKKQTEDLLGVWPQCLRINQAFWVKFRCSKAFMLAKIKN
jgi:hypothetical protein